MEIVVFVRVFFEKVIFQKYMSERPRELGKITINSLFSSLRPSTREIRFYTYLHGFHVDCVFALTSLENTVIYNWDEIRL